MVKLDLVITCDVKRIVIFNDFDIMLNLLLRANHTQVMKSCILPNIVHFYTNSIFIDSTTFVREYAQNKVVTPINRYYMLTLMTNYFRHTIYLP